MHQSAEGNKVWHELKAEVARHEFFADTDWAIREDERKGITDILSRHSPSDPMAIDRQVFDDWMPHVGRYKPGSGEIEDPDELRKEVIERVLAREGPAGVFRLYRTVKLPNLVGPVLRLTSITQSQLLDLLDLTLDQTGSSELALYVSAVGAERYGESWRAVFQERGLSRLSNDADKARLLLGWALAEPTWSFVQSLGHGVNNEYWRQMQTLPIHGTLDQLLFAIEQFRHRGRSLDVIALLYLRLKDLPTNLILSLLVEGRAQLLDCAKRMGNMLPHHLGRAFEELRKRSDVKEVEIAREEYAYLPVLSATEMPLTIISLMSKDPTFFIDILSHVFRGKNAPPPPEQSEEVKARAHVSYRLLSSFNTVPGLEQGKIDAATLSAWVTGARVAARGRDLGEISDLYIGHVFAHAPVDPDETFWPPTSICKIIETVSSDEIERGIHSECFNKRGVYSKAVNEGGKQERELASRYEEWAERTVHFPRTSAMLRGIAEMWTKQADDEDIRAEKRKMKM